MPRDPDNNPTDRIIRMITEWVYIKDWIREVEAFLKEEGFTIEPSPPAESLNEEITRQSITKVQTESQRQWRRRYRSMKERERISQIRDLGRQHGLDVQSKRTLISGMRDQLRAAGEEVPEDPPRPEPRKPPRLTKDNQDTLDGIVAGIKFGEKRDFLMKTLEEKGRMPTEEEFAEEEERLHGKKLSHREQAERQAEKAQLFGPSLNIPAKILSEEEIKEKLAAQEAALKEQEPFNKAIEAQEAFAEALEKKLEE